ncbi:MAG: sulfatase-like hydrolase/transferase [Bdellovibrionota bacterium]
MFVEKPKRKSWQNLVMAFSMANLALYSLWSFLEIHTNSLLSQYENESPYPATYIAMLTYLIAVTFLFHKALSWSQNRNVGARFAGKTLVTIGALFILNTLRQLLRAKTGFEIFSFSYLRSELGLWGGVPLLLAFMGALFYGMARYRQPLLSTTRFFLHLMFPVAVFHAGWVGYKLVTDDYGPTKQMAPVAASASPQRRVVFVVFDTMEERSSFSHRVAGLELPNFDAFRAQSFYGTQVYSPGARTQYSLTAFITGRMIEKAVPESGNDLWVTFSGEDHPERFSNLPTVFTESHGMGMRSALVGWYHPYCRMLGYSMNSCHYFSANEPNEMRPRKTLGANLSMFGSRILGTHPKYHPVVGAFERILEQGKKDAANPDYNLVFLHFPVPHLPGIYDRKTETLAYRGEAPSSEEHFWGNLALSDRALGEIRSEMEKTGVWETSAVILTSDHWWWHGEPSNQIYRPDGTLDYRVPLMVKLPHEKVGLEYKAPFNNVLVHDLMLDLLRNEIPNAEALKAWVDQKRGTTPLYPLIKTNIYG